MRTVLYPLAAVLVFVYVGTAQPPAGHVHGGHDKCAKACADCMLVCESCGHHCSMLAEKGQKDHQGTAALCRDCAAVCGTAAQITGRHGPLAATICKACAESCDACAAACEKHPADEHMAKCAAQCRACAKECREMVKGQ